MKKILFFLFLFLIPLALAKTETTKVLHFNETVTVEGKTLTTLGANPDTKVRVSVDGVDGIIRGINRTMNINEMWINMLNFTYVESESFDVIFELTVQFKCGDKFCNASETSISCCTDCGCEGNLKCINNICQEEECTIEWDCDDNNTCTVDKCSTTPPRTCSYTIIDKCVNNDTCCPSICGPVNDTDCIKTEEVIKETKPEKTENKPTEKVDAIQPEKVAESEKKVLITEKEKGILIIAGVALLVIIIGFLFFGKK
jgi:hypothetical protein